MFNHHTTNLIFRGNSALSVTPDSLHTILTNRFRQIDTASLVPLIWSRFGSGSYSKVVMSLANVCSPFSGYSTGYIGPPPKPCCPLNSHLLFTFATRLDTTYDPQHLEYQQVTGRSIFWGSGNTPRKFLTIAINSVEASDFNLMHVHKNEVEYLYRVLGIIFRSCFMHYTAGEIYDLKNGQSPVPDNSPYYYHDQYFNMALSGIVRAPYWAWQFNKEIWKLAPNVIPYKNLNPLLALYYFLFLTKLVRPDKPSYDGLSRLTGTVTGASMGIADVLVKSLLSFTQYLNNPSDYQFEIVDLIAPNVLASLLYTGHSKITLNRSNYLENMKENTVALAEQLRGSLVHGDLAQVFTPYTNVAQSILEEDSTLTNKLLNTAGVS